MFHYAAVDQINYDKVPGIFGNRHSVDADVIEMLDNESRVRRTFKNSADQITGSSFGMKQKWLTRRRSVIMLENRVEESEEFFLELVELKYKRAVFNSEAYASRILYFFRTVQKKYVSQFSRREKTVVFFRKYLNFFFAEKYFDFFFRVYGNSVTRRVWKELVEFFLEALAYVRFLDEEGVMIEMTEDAPEFNPADQPLRELNESLRVTFCFPKVMRTFVRLEDNVTIKSSNSLTEPSWFGTVFGHLIPNSVSIFSVFASAYNKFNFKNYERSSEALMFLNGRFENFGFYYRNTTEQLNQSWGNSGEFYAGNTFSEDTYFEVLYYKFVLDGDIEYDEEGFDDFYFDLENVKYINDVDFGMDLRATADEDDDLGMPSIVNWAKLGYFMIEDLGIIDFRTEVFYESTANFNVIFDSRVFGHPFHLVNPSILPVMLCFVFFTLIQDLLSSFWLEMWYDNLFSILSHAAMVGIFFSVILSWILEIYSEEQAGFHTLEVQGGFKYAILLFILSELMLFVSFFWAYFHFSLNSNSFTGGSYTPRGLVPFYSYRIPLLNTLLLLSSGLSLTVAHTLVVESDKIVKVCIWVEVLYNKLLSDWTHIWSSLVGGFLVYEGDEEAEEELVAVMSESFSRRGEQLSMKLGVSKKRTLAVTRYSFDNKTNYADKIGRMSNDFQVNLPKSFAINFSETERNTLWQPNYWILDTVLKGFVFLIFQAYEYTSCMFSMNDGVFGAVFFSLTGLHGIHVFIGVMFLFFGLLVNLNKNVSKAYYKKEVEYDDGVSKYNSRGSFLRTSMNSKIWTHRIAFDGAAWYWHFVDVVWFFVFVFVYWWGFSV